MSVMVELRQPLAPVRRPCAPR